MTLQEILDQEKEELEKERIAEETRLIEESVAMLEQILSDFNTFVKPYRLYINTLLHGSVMARLRKKIKNVTIKEYDNGFLISSKNSKPTYTLRVELPT